MFNALFHAQNRSSKRYSMGYLYNWYAASNSNFAPTNWAVPTRSNFQTLESYLSGNSVAGGKLKESGFLNWNSPNTGATNSSGFTGLGSGIRDEDGNFFNILLNTGFWTKDNNGGNSEYVLALGYDTEESFSYGTNRIESGNPIRLLYTGSGSPGSSMSDYDGNEYDIIQIGTQYWIKQNWKCTKLNDGTSLTKVTNATTWSNAGSGDYYYCAYNNNDSNV